MKSELSKQTPTILNDVHVTSTSFQAPMALKEKERKEIQVIARCSLN